MTSAIPVSQRSWVRFPFKPESFQVSSFQLLKLKHLHCDDLHIILSLSAVQIYDYFIYSCSLINYTVHITTYRKSQYNFLDYLTSYGAI